MEVSRQRDDERMDGAVAEFVGRAVRGATPRHYRPAVIGGRLAARPACGLLAGNPVVTGRETALRASGGGRGAKKIRGAGVMTLC